MPSRNTGTTSWTSRATQSGRSAPRPCPTRAWAHAASPEHGAEVARVALPESARRAGGVGLPPVRAREARDEQAGADRVFQAEAPALSRADQQDVARLRRCPADDRRGVHEAADRDPARAREGEERPGAVRRREHDRAAADPVGRVLGRRVSVVEARRGRAAALASDEDGPRLPVPAERPGLVRAWRPARRRAPRRRARRRSSWRPGPRRERPRSRRRARSRAPPRA